jgi:hypothetical protein
MLLLYQQYYCQGGLFLRRVYPKKNGQLSLLLALLFLADQHHRLVGACLLLQHLHSHCSLIRCLCLSQLLYHQLLLRDGGDHASVSFWQVFLRYHQMPEHRWLPGCSVQASQVRQARYPYHLFQLLRRFADFPLHHYGFYAGVRLCGLYVCV